eukprot:gnl/TRDRNA2_/TRDRNA2_186782_c0_seq1.p1 gnl/TRDRNA2_/TRDRNA2_186782_c0~~gnl/TRDRNA2_/TRDRNA2_186782_c0_seq1.p1  ORF type:complete len:436 (+),score=77.66 gnl/TRDRNA2_/TRDRNA2_186782_c0_seq1:132-1439(+)
MDQLVWASTKPQLYVLEAAHVKTAVGRDRIRRNKDALRELRCLQDILQDLHAGEHGSASPRRRVAMQAASARWVALKEAAVARGIAPESLCPAGTALRRFLLLQPTVSGGGAPRLRCASSAATSTRAPSTVAPDPDRGETESTAAESLYSEAGLSAEGGLLARPGGRGRRLTPEQLDLLAAELREQLDQEYTSLLASIEEVQALMEAEVSGAGLLPSRAELEDFVARADQVLANSDEIATSAASECEVASSHEAAAARSDEASAPASAPRTPSSGCLSSPVSPAGCSSKGKAMSWDASLSLSEEAVLFDVSLSRESKGLESHVRTDDGYVLEHAPAISTVAVAAVPTPRPRWADLSDSEEGAGAQQSGLAASVPAASACDGGGRGVAHATCSRCAKQLPRSGFSRRAWRQARGLGATAGEPRPAACLLCSKQDVG